MTKDTMRKAFIELMKILICNTLEKRGGAAKATSRITSCIKKNNIDIETFSFFKDGEEKTSIVPKIDALPKLILSKKRKTPFSSSLISFKRKRKIYANKVDILHLNYTNMGMFSIKEIANIKTPIAWTIHDSWAFTGGCHLPHKCDRYKSKCQECPALGSRKNFDLSTYIFLQKEKHWKNKNITIVCPSKWLLKKVKQSKLFKNNDIHLIPNPIDTEIFKPMDRSESRKKFNLDKEKKYILFGAVNPLKDRNKGFHLLKQAIEKINLENTELLIFGEDKIDIDLKIPFRNIGYIETNYELSELYSAVDLTVLPSLSENLPNVLIESLACGTPCIGFKVGGIPEIISKKDFGEVIEKFDTEKLGGEIKNLLNKNKVNREKLNKEIRERYGYKTIGEKYKKLYQNLTL